MDKTSLGNRMKGYESVPSVKLMRRTPVIMRLDGKAFHTYTRQSLFTETGPFSMVLRNIFREATMQTLKHIQGARLAYMQSDEVSILLTDWKQLNTDAWFKYGAQKMVSVASSIFTFFFNREAEYAGLDSFIHPAFFDARVFNVPFEEVTNYFVWRQQDATRNSIQMLARAYFSHKQLDRMNTSKIQDMLMDDHKVNWNDTKTCFKRGSCIRSHYDIDKRLTFEHDFEIPVFTQDRDYIEDHLKFEN